MNTVNLALSQKQDLRMTTELREAIEMLALNALEVQDLVAREAAENPLLDVEGSEPADDTATPDEGDWDDNWDTWAVRDEGADGPVGAAPVSGGGDGGWEATATKAESLQEYVLRQYEEIVTDAKMRLVGRFLVDALGEDGYLHVDMADVAARLGVDEELVDDARAVLQTLDPAGVGARDLAECLRLQLHAKGLLDPVTEVCVAHLDWVATKQWEKIAAEAGCNVAQVATAMEDFQQCNPKPGLAFGSGGVEVVVPEVIVEKVAGVWRVALNGAAFPKLGVGSAAGMLGGGSDRGGEGRKYIADRQARAKWLISALEQRAHTIDRVAKEIVAAQELFFEAGAEFLQPMTLRQVAEKVGVHESTVSRVTSGKYMQTPRGVLEFKYFFSSGVGSTGGAVDVAATSVQAMIGRLVKAEDPRRPLSDEKIVLLLKNEGVEVARRTVAKYRGILGIPGTAERRLR